MAIKLNIEITGHLKFDEAHQTMISSLGLALIKDLHYNLGRLLDHAESWLDLRTQETREDMTNASKGSFQQGWRVFLIGLVVYI